MRFINKLFGNNNSSKGEKPSSHLSPEDHERIVNAAQDRVAQRVASMMSGIGSQKRAIIEGIKEGRGRINETIDNIRLPEGYEGLSSSISAIRNSVNGYADGKKDEVGK